MSRIARWKIEKTKVKVVFRLQFHATHIPQSGWDKLFISFIPADSGKATAKTTKANVRNGTCKWGDPIYETTRLLQDIKTKQFDEKLYKLVVSMGSSRSSVFGEATINLSDYADASQPSAVALPLHGCDSGAILHVTTQLLTSKTGFREFEQQREIREKGFQSGTDPNGPDQSSHRSLTEEVNNSQVDKVIARVRFREKPKEHQLLEDVGLNGEYSDSAVGFDGSSNTSESFNAEKHDTSSTHEIDSLRSTASGELAGLSQSPQKEKGDLSDGRYLTQGANNLVRSWSSDYSVDNDIINAYEENIRLRGCLEMTESSVNELKAEVCSLKAHSDEMSVETQMFAQQLAAEISSGEELAKEVSVLKLECSKLKSELDQVNGDKQIGKMSLPESDRYSLGTGPDPELFQPDLAMLRAVSIPSQVSNEPDSLDAATAMKEKIFELLRELDESKAERESLAKKMDQMECYYEALVQELEENQRQMLGELQSLRNEHSTCLYTFQSTKVEMETMHREMNKQILRFAEEKTELESMTKELERRAVTAEAAVKRARLNYSIAVEQLQKDLEVLSFQVLSMYETHENLIKECIIDSPPTSFQGDPKMMQNRQKLESEEFHSTKLLQCQNHYAGMKKHRSGDILLEDMQKSLQLQEGIYRKVDEEVCEMHYVNVYLDVFSSTLKETLLEASCDARLMKKRFDELTQQQELLMESKELVLRRLQTAMDDIHFLNEEKTVFVAKCDEMAVEKQNLEANLEDLTHENSRLTLKINEMESMIMEYKSYKNKYDACAVEKTELANLLREETQENGYLRNDISSTQEELKKMKAEFEEVITVKKDLQNTLDFLQNRLQNLLSSYDQSFDVTESDGECFESKDLNGLLVRFEGMQNIAVEKILQLSKEKKDLMDERDKARESLSMVESDKLLLKETFEHDVKNMNVLFQKLQLEIEAVSDKLKFSSEVEENHARQQETLLSEFNCLEVELQQLTSKNGEITQEIFALESINHELENSKLQISELEAKNKVLTFSLQDKSEELSRLSTELNCLKESLQCLQDELLAERSSKDNVESIASDRSMHFDQQKSELVRLEEMVSELESEKSRVCYLLQDKSEESSRLSAELDCLKESLQCLQDELLAERGSKDKLESIVSDWSMHFDQQKSELIRLKEMVSGLESEKSRVCHLLQDKSEESSRFSTELNCLKESLKCLQDELLAERSSKDKLESIVADRSMHFEQQKSEVARLKEMVSELELEKSRVCRLLLQSEEHLKNAGNESSSSRLLEAELSEMLQLSVAADVSLVFVRTQYEAWTEDLVQKLNLSRSHATELQYMYLNVESMMNRCLASESHYTEENAKLLTSLNSLKSDLEAAVAENKTLFSTNCATSSELEIYKRRVDEMKVNQCEEKRRHALQFERLEQLLVNSQEEIDNLLLLKEEHEVELLVLKSKLEEQSAHLSSSEGDEVILLQNQCNELSQKLSEQILRTAEFRNLSIHLRELKDKAEEECAKAREKRDSEAPSTPTQESLRIVFIKEQYETKLQEIKRQLAVSKKHREEMLWKLQDAVDEVENRKKSEASHLKKNEELGMKILELEAELQEVSSDKREKVIVYDRMKAELECSMISLDCCKEEKQKLEASLQECIEEKKKISDELSTAKQLLEDLKSNGVNGDGSLVPANQEDLQSKDSKFLALFNDQFRAESLRSSLDHLNNELERMKNENLHDSEDDNHFDQKFPGLERELMQLSKVNDELATIYPFFNGYSATGNALQRVLALEIELAESLQNKRKSNFNFQSSFLKQHGDEEAIFKSFRDINELIKDMLELKGRYSSVETELKEMHGRYSQLSLQFAEVEGERQKLMMTLKSVRAARNNQHLIRSSSATLGDQS